MIGAVFFVNEENRIFVVVENVNMKRVELYINNGGGVKSPIWL